MYVCGMTSELSILLLGLLYVIVHVCMRWSGTPRNNLIDQTCTMFLEVHQVLSRPDLVVKCAGELAYHQAFGGGYSRKLDDAYVLFTSEDGTIRDQKVTKGHVCVANCTRDHSIGSLEDEAAGWMCKFQKRGTPEHPGMCTLPY
jgi:hypothetical protein